MPLVGLQLGVEDQLFVGEVLGVDPGTVARLTLEARQAGWPEGPAQRELLRPLVRRATAEISANSGGSGAYTLAFRKLVPDASAGCKTCPQVGHSPGTPLPEWRTLDSSIEAGGCRILEFPVRSATPAAARLARRAPA